MGTAVQITGNIVESLSTGNNAIGILLEGERRAGETPFDGSGVISANRVTGLLSGILITDCRGVDIDDNQVGPNDSGTPEAGIAGNIVQV